MFDRTNNKEQIYILSHRHSERFQFLENTIAVGKFKKFRRCYVGNDKGGGKKKGKIHNFVKSEYLQICFIKLRDKCRAARDLCKFTSHPNLKMKFILSNSFLNEVFIYENT